jgi:phosphotransferase system HPr (HPr) family protein
MAEITVSITEPGGLHLRAAALVVQTAARFTSRVWMCASTRPDAAEIDAKSLFSVLQSGIMQGQQIRVCAEGPDADAALAALRTLFEQNVEER